MTVKYHQDSTGLLLYAKQVPQDLDIWNNEVTDLDEIGTTGTYFVDLDPSYHFIIYEKLGGDYADTDLVRGVFGPEIALADPLPPTGGPLPAVDDVRFGVAYGEELVGVLELPSEDYVLSGVEYGAYGTEFAGTLESIGADLTDAPPPVLSNGSLAPLIVGGNYTDAVGRAFEWTVTLWPGFDPETAVIVFRGRNVKCGCTAAYEWEVTGTATLIAGDSYTLSFNLPHLESLEIEAGSYFWWVVVDDVPVATGTVDWLCG